MQEKLVIYLQAENSLPHWAVVDSEGVVRQTALHDQPQGLAQIAEGKEVIVLICALYMTLFLLALPKMNKSRLKQALPYALEDQLISDIATLHFSAGDYQTNGELPVNVIADEKMQQWFKEMKSWQIEPDVMMSVIFALPEAENELNVFVDDLALVRTGTFQGFACDKNNLDQLLHLAEKNAGENVKLIHVYNFSGETLAFKDALISPYQEEKLDPAFKMQWLAKNAASALNKINLLNGKYAVKKSKLPSILKIWKISAYLVAGIIAISLFSPLISYLILSQKMRSIDHQVAQIYKHNFPNATNIVAPKIRLEEKLRKLSSQMSDNRLLALLGYLGKGMLETPSIKLKRFDFQNNQLTVELTAATTDDFSQFTDFLNRLGLTVKQQNVNLNGDRINAALTIEM